TEAASNHVSSLDELYYCPCYTIITAWRRRWWRRAGAEFGERRLDVLDLPGPRRRIVLAVGLIAVGLARLVRLLDALPGVGFRHRVGDARHYHCCRQQQRSDGLRHGSPPVFVTVRVQACPPPRGIRSIHK